ncbi:tRNA 2-selenouridine(34) synthase MnmH [Calditerrivibrio sp.]|jgi:tRNA 2-selenouridine synthase|uniref:tRNA 2-selenouridine(34) synthase MnmH n=1 Tax=Calditerrivibrio sp. TaxID=2792612 RepID=UPI003D109F39
MKDLIDLAYLEKRRYQDIGLIDVRSENEFSIDHLPNAINIPLLNNEERTIIGTIYKQQGPKEARLKGVEIVSPKLIDFIDKIKKVTENYKDTIIYCWRGGLRSETSVTFARLAGLTVSRLSGGYKIYRSRVNSFFENDIEKYTFITLYGPTGGGKTEILRCLNNLNYPVMDIEKHASHKGSIFGHIEEPGYDNVNQKNFETGLYYDLIKTNKSLYLAEGESKKVGKVVIPTKLFAKITGGVAVVCNPSMEFRINYTVKNYNPSHNLKEIVDSLEKIKRYTEKGIYNDLMVNLEKGDFHKFTEIILEKYYDPMYKHSYPKNIACEISYNTIDEAVKKIKEFYDAIFAGDNFFIDSE